MIWYFSKLGFTGMFSPEQSVIRLRPEPEPSDTIRINQNRWIIEKHIQRGSGKIMKKARISFS